MKKNSRTKVKYFARKINKCLKDFQFREFKNFHFHLRVNPWIAKKNIIHERKGLILKCMA